MTMDKDENVDLAALESKWGWALEGADRTRLTDTLIRLDLAEKVAINLSNHGVFVHEVALLCAEGAIRG